MAPPAGGRSTCQAGSEGGCSEGEVPAAELPTLECRTESSPRCQPASAAVPSTQPMQLLLQSSSSPRFTVSSIRTRKVSQRFSTPALQVKSPLLTISQDTLWVEGRLVVCLFFCVCFEIVCVWLFFFACLVDLTWMFVGGPLCCALLCKCPTGEL